MTSAQTMLGWTAALGHAARAILLAGMLISGLLSAGCRAKPELTPPGVLVSPYAGDALFAVIPPRNESGASFVDPDRVGDMLVAALAQTRGLRCLPLNRTLEAMRALGLPSVNSAMEANQLARALGVDGIVAATITAYDPYDPPTIGLMLALFPQPSLGGRREGPLDDPRLLAMQASDAGYTGMRGSEPTAVESVHLDARSHDVLLRLRRYAEGRKEKETALDWRIYTASMDLYTQFGAHEAVRGLLDHEWLRLARVASHRD